MSAPLLLRTFVSERLTAAAEEIAELFERTVAKYEEEASSSRREIRRLRALLLRLMENHEAGVWQPLVCKEEPPNEWDHCERETGPSAGQREPEPRLIKEEHRELGSSQQEENQWKDGDVQWASAAGDGEHEETKASVLREDQDGEGPTRLQEMEEMTETEPLQFVLSVTSHPSPGASVQHEGVQDGGESQRSVAGFTVSDQAEERSPAAPVTDESPLASVNADFHCCLCNKSFSYNHHLVNHAFRVHSGDSGGVCAVCGATADSPQSLDVHLKSHRGLKSCQVCGKQCNSASALTEHMCSHTGVKLHRCHVCGKQCSRKGDLKIHMRIHTGEKPFCCSFCCKSFTHSGHLRKHMRSHTGERPHRCDVCGRRFLQSTHLKYHLGTHTHAHTHSHTLTAAAAPPSP